VSRDDTPEDGFRARATSPALRLGAIVSGALDGAFSGAWKSSTRALRVATWRVWGKRGSHLRPACSARPVPARFGGTNQAEMNRQISKSSVTPRCIRPAEPAVASVASSTWVYTSARASQKNGNANAAKPAATNETGPRSNPMAANTKSATAAA